MNSVEPSAVMGTIASLIDRKLVYTRIGHESRLLVLRADGTLEGGGEREAYWSPGLSGTDEIAIYGSDALLTVILQRHCDSVWNGNWSVCERMPVELRLVSEETLNPERDYSQNGEQHFILEYFREQQQGVFLDVGAADGVTDSNTRALALKGWTGVLVEPVPEEYWQLEDNYAGFREVLLINAALAEEDGYGKMWIAEQPSDAGSAHGDNRHTLDIATMKAASEHPFRPARYSERVVRTISPRTLTRRLGKRADFLSVDAEGMDVWIVDRLLELGMRPQMIVLEIDKMTNDGWRDSLVSYGYDERYRTVANSLWAMHACRANGARSAMPRRSHDA